MCSNKEKEVLFSLIDIYKGMPYLWNKNHKDYLNRSVRVEGFRVLLEIYKSFDENATMKTIKKKIENMRTNYSKELRKVLLSRHIGAGPHNLYVPSLWYFNALSFLGTKTESFRSMTDYEMITLKNENLSSDDETASVAFSSGQKRKKTEMLMDKQENIIKTAETIVKNLSHKDEQWEVYGRSIGFQIKDLNERQLVICQKIISDAIFCAKLDKLNENSHIVSNEPTFQQHNLYSPLSTYSSPSPHSSFAPRYHTQLVHQQLLENQIQPSNKVPLHQPSPNAHYSLQTPLPYHQQSPNCQTSPSPQQSPYHYHSSPPTLNIQDQSPFTLHQQSPTRQLLESPSHQLIIKFEPANH